ncbi:hypothetical protein Nmel_014921, partial [Mimus melanotis]
MHLGAMATAVRPGTAERPQRPRAGVERLPGCPAASLIGCHAVGPAHSLPFLPISALPPRGEGGRSVDKQHRPAPAFVASPAPPSSPRLYRAFSLAGVHLRAGKQPMGGGGSGRGWLAPPRGAAGCGRKPEAGGGAAAAA